MANVGTIEYKYDRYYVLTNPNAAAGPATWRVSTSDSSQGGGGGDGYIFNGVEPIATSVVINPSGPDLVNISFNLQSLPPRT